MKSALYESYKFVDSKENQLAVIDERELLGKEFRIYGNLDNPLFLAKDVANWIEHNQVSRMIELVDTDEKLKCLVSTSGKNEDGNLISSISGDGQRREMWFLTEDGLYEVLMQSRKPIAKKFKKQIKQILKQIRQTGGYIPHSEEDDDATIMARALLISQKTIEKKNKQLQLAEEENIKLCNVIDSYKPKVEYVDEILNCKDALLTTNIAFDYGLSAQALNKILCEERVQRRVRGQYVLYADYMGKGYTETETRMIRNKLRIHTLWTTKGRMLIHEILNKRSIKALKDMDQVVEIDNVTQLNFN